MALPKLDQPTFTLTVPSTGNQITYRPFLVKEEKVLMIAQKDGDISALVRATKQIINNCVISGDLNVEKMTSFDMEYIFLKLRSKSVGDVVELTRLCEQEGCGAPIGFNINLNDVEVTMPENVQMKVELTDTVGVILRYPDVNDIGRANPDDEIASAFDIIASCVDQIYDADEVYHSKDTSPTEIQEWIEHLSQEQFMLIREFFESIPKVQIECELKCPKCDDSQKVVVEGLQNFFQ